MRKWTGSIAVFFFVLGGCVDARAAGPATDMQKVLTRLEDYAKVQMKAEKVPGMAYAIVRNGKMIFAKGFGVKESGGTAPVDEHTVFEIGSCTKAFTATLLAMMVDRKKVRWEDPVREHLPGFKMNDPWVTREFRVDDLMSQRSGMRPYSLDVMSFLGFDRESLVHAVRYVKPEKSFRHDFNYVNSLSLVTAKLIETKTAKSWEENIEQEIFTPLGMVNSAVDPAVISNMKNIAKGHMVLSSGKLWPLPKDWPYRGWIDSISPAGGIRSNVVDMTHWIELQLAGGIYNQQRLVKAGGIDFTHKPMVYMSKNRFGGYDSYASGWVYNSWSPVPLIWHDGGTVGMHSIVGLMPSDRMGIVVLTNTSSNHLPEKLMGALYYFYHGIPLPTAKDGREAFIGPVLDRSPLAVLHAALPATARIGLEASASAEALPPAKYQGSYFSIAYRYFVVELEAGNLFVVMGPNKIRAPLTRIKGNHFKLTLPSWPDIEEHLWFSVSGGEVRSLTTSLCTDVDNGLFLKE